MEVIIIPLVVFLGSILTFFSGFGLGTILLPAFSLFFPIEVAVFSTAIVHFFNSLFKVILIYKKINYSIFWKFALTAIPFAIFGALILGFFNKNDLAIKYSIISFQMNTTLLNIIIGSIMVLFAVIELFFKSSKFTVSKTSLFLGGAISGFFGGLSGHQGAFRSMFLSKAEVTKEEFVATSSSIGFLIDLTRISVYLSSIPLIMKLNHSLQITLLISILLAFFGSFLGTKILHKTTMKSVQYIVALLLLLMGILIIAGFL